MQMEVRGKEDLMDQRYSKESDFVFLRDSHWDNFLELSREVISSSSSFHCRGDLWHSIPPRH